MLAARAEGIGTCLTAVLGAFHGPETLELLGVPDAEGWIMSGCVSMATRQVAGTWHNAAPSTRCRSATTGGTRWALRSTRPCGPGPGLTRTEGQRRGQRHGGRPALPARQHRAGPLCGRARPGRASPAQRHGAGASDCVLSACTCAASASTSPAGPNLRTTGRLRCGDRTMPTWQVAGLAPTLRPASSGCAVLWGRTETRRSNARSESPCSSPWSSVPMIHPPRAKR